MNLLEETINDLANMGKTTSDVQPWKSTRRIQGYGHTIRMKPFTLNSLMRCIAYADSE